MAKYNIETKIEAIRLYKSGIGSTTIASRLGISKDHTVLNWIKEPNTNQKNINTY